MQRTNKIYPYLFLQFNVILMGFTGVLGKLITLDAINLVFWRLVLTTIGFLLLFSFRLKALFTSPHLIRQAFFIGFFMGLHFLSFYAAIKLSNVSIALATFALTSVFSALFEPLILRSKMSYFDLLCGCFVVGLMFWMLQAELRFWQGFLLGIASAMFYAILTVLNSTIAQKKSSQFIMFWEILGAGLIISAMLYLSPITMVGWQEISELNWVYLFLLSWVSTLFAYTMLVHLLKTFPPFTINLTINLEPVYGIILAMLVFQEEETMSLEFYIAFCLILLVIIMHPILKKRITY